MLCSCVGCSTIVSDFELCELHKKEFDKVKGKRRQEWLDKQNIFITVNNRFKNCGRKIEDICGQCGNRFIRKERGVKHVLCLVCLKENVDDRMVGLLKISNRRTLAEKVRKNLPVESDPRYKPYRHRGTPLKVEWSCENSECSNSFEVTLLEHKLWYNRYCEEHRE